MYETHFTESLIWLFTQRVWHYQTVFRTLLLGTLIYLLTNLLLLNVQVVSRTSINLAAIKVLIHKFDLCDLFL